MALTDADVQRVYEIVGSMLPDSEVTYGAIIATDKDRKLIKVEDFGDQWIPLVGFKQKVKIYDEYPLGGSGAYGGKSTKVKTYVTELQMPDVGDTAVVLRQLGARRLPKCVGIILSAPGWVEV